MLKKFVYLYLFLSTSSIRCNEFTPGVEDNIKRYVKVETSSVNSSKYYQKKVSFLENDVPINSPELLYTGIVINSNSHHALDVDQAYSLYLAINCKMSSWLIQRISNFIDSSPILYRSVFQEDDHYNDLYKSSFEYKLNSLIIEIKKHSTQFISILNNFFDTYSDSSFYINTYISKVIISLNIKIHLMTTRNSDNTSNFNKPHSEIIQLLVEEMNAIQKFLPMSCEYTPHKSRTSLLYGYWIHFTDDIKDDLILDTFLFQVDKTGLGLVDKLQNCSIEQIFMKKFMDSNDHIANDIANTKVLINNTTITVKAIADQMYKSFDIDVIVWYYDIVLSTVVKLMYYKASKLADFNPKYNPKIKEIINKLKKLNIPEFDGFKQLKVNDRFNKTWSDKLTELCDSIKHIKLDVSENDTKLNEENYLEMLLKAVLDNLNDINCAHEYLKNVLRENKKYYIPGITKKEILLEPNAAEENLCELVLNIYDMSFRAYMDTYIFESNPNDDQVLIRFRTIKNICVGIIKYEKKNYHLIKMAYNIATILKNQDYDKEKKDGILLQFKRVLNIIMTELNTFNNKYCFQQTSNYFLFNKVNLINLGDSEAFKTFMTKIFDDRYQMDHGKHSIDLEHIPPSEDLNYFQVEYLYDAIVNKSNAIDSYGDKISVYWNRQLKQIKTIFSDSKRLSFDPQSMYALYDIYFKFYLAVVYYEIKQVLLYTDFSELKTGLQNLTNTLSNFNADSFPKELGSLISDLKTILKFENSEEAKSDEDKYDAIFILKEKASKVDVQFKKFSYEISEPTSDKDKQLVSQTTKLALFEYTPVILFNEELNTNFADFKDVFSKLRL